MTLWRDTAVPGGLELLRASCFAHSYPAHSHDDFVIAVFSRGAQRYRIAHRHGVAAAGTVMIIHPDEVHEAEAVERDDGWEHCAFYPTRRLLDEIGGELLSGCGSIEFGTEPIQHDPHLAARLLRLHEAIARSSNPVETCSLVDEAFATLISRYGQKRHPGRAPTGRRADVGRAIDFIQASYGNPISVTEIAAVAGLSEAHFMRAFKAATGLTVHAYLTQTRLDRAKALMIEGRSAAETAVSVGLFDQSHLIRRFRQHYGVTPHAYCKASR